MDRSRIIENKKRSKQWYALIRASINGNIDQVTAEAIMKSPSRCSVDFELAATWDPEKQRSPHQHN